ncbi:hypothetical protein BC830DRAFT_743180 [Chytriomyces sp. MP71]|nr:hypothetical protein BC830DRAFT_743180 [Chytriomyces sp. MP71]
MIVTNIKKVEIFIAVASKIPNMALSARSPTVPSDSNVPRHTRGTKVSAISIPVHPKTPLASTPRQKQGPYPHLLLDAGILGHERFHNVLRLSLKGKEGVKKVVPLRHSEWTFFARNKACNVVSTLAKQGGNDACCGGRIRNLCAEGTGGTCECAWYEGDNAGELAELLEEGKHCVRVGYGNCGHGDGDGARRHDARVATRLQNDRFLLSCDGDDGGVGRDLEVEVLCVLQFLYHNVQLPQFTEREY